MESITAVVSALFYALVLGSALYFMHKIAWFLRYRTLQERLVQRALTKLREQADTTVVRWDRGADVSWSEASASSSRSQADYVRRVEKRLDAMEDDLGASRQSVREALVAAVTRAPAESEEPSALRVLELPTDHPAAVDVRFDLVPVQDPRLPPSDYLALDLHSRYGFVRRALAFFLGVADVVYSSRHLVRMSQNPRIPTGLLLRRVSLVLLILLALLVDFAFGLRARLIDWAASVLPNRLSGRSQDELDALAAGVGLGLWLLSYGALYVGLYVYLRIKSGRYVRELEEVRRTLSDRVADIRDAHLDGLAAWAGRHGESLDEAAKLTESQASMLIQRVRQRLRRRVASPELLDLAEEVAGLFFAQLPEASTGLQDFASTHRHSLGHALWPREREMSYQTRIAQFRFAWRDIEFALHALRGELPDPDLSAQLWRSLVRYARMFPEVVPDDLFARLQEAHGATVATIVSDTDADLAELEHKLGNLGAALQQTMHAAVPLVQSRIELTERAMNGAVAAYIAEARRTRERARLEAMAFEI